MAGADAVNNAEREAARPHTQQKPRMAATLLSDARSSVSARPLDFGALPPTLLHVSRRISATVGCPVESAALVILVSACAAAGTGASLIGPGIRARANMLVADLCTNREAHVMLTSLVGGALGEAGRRVGRPHTSIFDFTWQSLPLQLQVGAPPPPPAPPPFLIVSMCRKMGAHAPCSTTSSCAAAWTIPLGLPKTSTAPWP